MNTFTVLISLGTLQVYESHPLQGPFQQEQYFWMDAASPQGIGPFMSINDALINYTEIVAYDKLDPNVRRTVTTGALIRVDFKNKRRVLPAL